MSEMESSSSHKGSTKGVPSPLRPPLPPPHPPGGGSDVDFMSFPSQQQQSADFAVASSWRSNPPPPPHPPHPDYNNFYYSNAGAAYSPFSPGDIRDSIAAIWSRTSPSGEVPLGGAYGQFHPPPPVPDGGALHHLPGHFPPAHEMSGLFPPEQYGGGFPYGYGFTQWPTENGGRSTGAGNTSAGALNPGNNLNNASLPPSSSMNSSSSSGYLEHGGPNSTSHHHHHPPHPQPLPHNNNRMNASNDLALMAQLMENTKIKAPGKLLESSTNGYNGSSNKKMSWAKVASQPAKPVKSKKPGVLSPPSLLPLNSKQQQQQQQQNTEVSPQSAVPPAVIQQQAYGPLIVEPNGKARPPSNYGPRSHHRKDGGTHHPSSASNNNNVAAMMSNHHHHHHHSQQVAAPSSSNGPRGGGSSESHPVLESLRSANEYNPKNFDLNPQKARYFVLKSFCEDDIHRSIKFEIWCSTQHGNKRLDAAWNEQQSAGGPLYLFFSVNGSGHFCGMAQMLTGVDYSSTTNSVWVQDKFKGQFKVKWIYVKDVPNNQLRHILLENNENKPVTKSRDTQEVPSEKGVMLLKVLHGYRHTTCIFDDFAHYERRQEVEESKKIERQQQLQQHQHDKSHDKRSSKSHNNSHSSNNHNNSGSSSHNNAAPAAASGSPPNNSVPWEWEMNHAPPHVGPPPSNSWE